MSALLDLAAKVEALTGPCRETDEAIARAVGWAIHNTNCGPDWVNSKGHVQGLPEWTRSLDAAMTLVPEGWTFANLSESDSKRWWCELRKGFLTSYDDVRTGTQLEGGNPAIAITAAALRARAAVPTTDRGGS